MSKTRLKASNLFRSICICKIACEKEIVQNLEQCLKICNQRDKSRIEFGLAGCIYKIISNFHNF